MVRTFNGITIYLLKDVTISKTQSPKNGAGPNPRYYQSVGDTILEMGAYVDFRQDLVNILKRSVQI